MILNKEIIHEAEYIGDIQENKVGIDLKNIDFITSLLTSNLYSNPVKSFFRETVSNAYDSHVEVGTEDPILILIEDKSKDKFQISIRDYGTGLSPERFDLIYKNIGSSTKRDSNDFIGMFGIGRFAALSCADEALVTSYYNGTKYSYIMYKNGRGINIDKLSEDESDYKNGLEVSVCVSTSASAISEALDELSFFPHIYVQYENPANNYRLEYSISEFNDRTVREMDGFSLCNIITKSYYKVGKVLYPIVEGDFKEESGICIDLEVGSVDITPNREALQWTPKTKEVIKSAEEKVKQSLAKIISNDGNAISLAHFASVQSNSYYYSIPVFGIKITTALLKSLPALKFNVEGEIIDSDFLAFYHQVKHYSLEKDWIYKASFGEKRHPKDTWGTVLQHAIYQKKDKVLKPYASHYFQDEVLFGEYVVFKPEIFEDIKDYYTKEFIGTPIEVIDTFIRLVKKNLKIIGNDSVPEEYRKSYTSIKTKKESTDISVRVYNGFSYRIFRLKTILETTLKGIIIYTQNTNDTHVIGLLGTVSRFRGFLPIAYAVTVTKKSLPILKKNKKCVSLDDFLYGKHKMISKIVTAKYILNNFPKSCHPLYRQFHAIYKREIELIDNSSMFNPLLEELYTLYMERGWYNKADVKRFTISEEKMELLEDIAKTENLIREDINAIINRLLIRKYGIVPEAKLKPKPLKINI